MARVKAVTSFQSRLFQFWVFASLAFGAVSLLLGLDLLRGETIIYNLIPADAFDGLGAVWTAIFYLVPLSIIDICSRQWRHGDSSTNNLADLNLCPPSRCLHGL